MRCAFDFAVFHSFSVELRLDAGLSGVDRPRACPLATNGDESMATFSSAKTIHESADVVRVAAFFPSPQVVEREEPTEVDWEAALPPRGRWPAYLGDLYADNPTVLSVRERGQKPKR